MERSTFTQTFAVERKTILKIFFSGTSGGRVFLGSGRATLLDGFVVAAHCGAAVLMPHAVSVIVFFRVVRRQRAAWLFTRAATI